MLPIGCEIQDIVQDIDYNRIVDAYLKFKHLGESPALAPAQRLLLKDAGILREPELLFALESGYQEAVATLTKKQQKPSKWQPATKTSRSR